MSTYATDTFAGDGSTVEFTLTFKYISRDHVEVYRVDNADGAETKLSVITTGAPTGDEFIWDSDTKIKVGTAPTNLQTLKIQRDTPENQQLVPWNDGSYLIAEDLNDSDLQWLYNIQELTDRFSELDSEAIKYRGTIDLTVDAAPANPQNGDFYINSGSGTVVATWTGIDGDSVTGSEQVIYNSSLGEWELLKTPASQKGVLEVKGTAPIQVDTTDAQRPVVSVDAATTTDAGVITEAASDGVTYGRENGAWVAVANTAVGTDPPASPSNGDGWYDLNSGRLFLWVDDGNSSQWAEANPGLAGGGGASVEVDDTPPTTPKEGDLWWDSSDGSGRLYVWYEDADTNQWVEASPGGGSGLTEVYWTDSGTALSPKTAGRDVTLGAGDVSATDGTFSGNVSGVDGTFTGNVDIGSGNISLNADGTATFGNSVTIGAAAVPPPSHDPAGSLSVTQGDADGARIRLKNTVALNDGGFDVLAVSNTASHGRASELGVYQNSSSSLAGKVAGFIKLPVYNTDDYYYWPDSNGVFRTSTTRTHVGLQQGTVVGTQTSDIRLKQNIADCTYGLDEVTRLQPKTFEYKTAPGVTHAGFIAQEVKTIIPEAVYDTGEPIGDDAETKLAMAYVELIPALVNAIKEQSTRIEALEAANASLEARLTALKGGTN